jgi:hypothetical protein
MYIIGLTGKATVGKTTTARQTKEILKNEGIESKVLSFAYPLKLAACILTGLTMRYFTDFDLKEKEIVSLGVTPREFLQKLGTEFARRMICYNFWIIRMQQSLELHKDIPVIFIDDVRFENEASLVRSRGGKIVHLHRDVSLITNSSHVSEQGLIEYSNDIVINANEATAEEVATMLIDFNKEELEWRGQKQ